MSAVGIPASLHAFRSVAGSAAHRAAIGAIVLLLALAGCQRGTEGDGQQAAGDQAAGDRAAVAAVAARPATPLELAGRSLATEVGCLECHVADGDGAGGHDDRLPLTDPARHDQAWLEEHVRDPMSTSDHRLLSRIPGAERLVLSRELYDEEIACLAAWAAAVRVPGAAVLGASPEEIRHGRLFFDYACSECHRVHGAGGTRGPDLSRQETAHERAWLREQILTPKQHDPDGEMPTYAGKISDADLEALLDYLETLR